LGFTAGGSEQFCRQTQPLLTMVKALGSYTIPRVGLSSLGCRSTSDLA